MGVSNHPPDPDTDACLRCGYALHGIADDQPCPECGLLAQRSRRPSDELYDTRPGWLRRLSCGVNFILLAIVAGAGWPFVADWVMDLFYRWLDNRSISFSPWFYVNGPLFGLELAAAILELGVWLLTGREGHSPADRADRWLRRALRITALAPLVALILYHLSLEMVWGSEAYRTRPYLNELSVLLVVLAALAFIGIGLVALPALLFRHLRGLAGRARSAHLVEHCTIVGIGTSLTVLYLLTVALLFGNSEKIGLPSNWVSRSNVAMLLMLAVATLGILFVLWSLYLLIRFAISFAKASRRLRRKWREQDRSVVAIRV